MKRNRRPSRQTRAVLAALSADPTAWRYGYDLSKETGLASGTLYPLLMRLDQRGFLTARWEPPREGRRARHVYRLTAAGLEYAAEAEREQVRPTGRLAVDGP
jgi:DNA-binding PadR family transcriptional regulator